MSSVVPARQDRWVEQSKHTRQRQGGVSCRGKGKGEELRWPVEAGAGKNFRNFGDSKEIAYGLDLNII